MKKIKKKLRRALGLQNNTASFTKIRLAEEIKKHGYEVGDYSYGKPKLLWHSRNAPLKIGSYCSFGENVTILLGGNHHTERVTTYPFAAFRQQWGLGKEWVEVPLSKGGVTIGSDVWVADNATILSGITIGHGAVVANNAVVTKDVPPYAIVAGNPAKVVKKRFDDEIIEKLLKTKWWELNSKDIKTLIPYLLGSDIVEFVAECKKIKK